MRQGGSMDRIRSIFEGDRLIQDFGMKLLEAREGYAKVSVVVEERFLNAHHIGHGVLLFAAADAAFAVSVNASLDAVGVQWSFNIFRSTTAGDRIKAEAKVIHRGRSMMVVDFRAESEKTGKLIAQGMATSLPLPKKEK